MLRLQESEIAEVLYKQDVDLGFSLDQEKIINASYASGNSAAKQRAYKTDSQEDKADDYDKKASDNDHDNDDDNIEKLKALEDLQQNEVSISLCFSNWKLLHLSINMEQILSWKHFDISKSKI